MEVSGVGDVLQRCVVAEESQRGQQVGDRVCFVEYRIGAKRLAALGDDRGELAGQDDNLDRLKPALHLAQHRKAVGSGM